MNTISVNNHQQHWHDILFIRYSIIIGASPLGIPTTIKLASPAAQTWILVKMQHVSYKIKY